MQKPEQDPGVSYGESREDRVRFVSRVLTVVTIVACVGFALWLLVLLVDLFFLVFAGFLFAIFLRSGTNVLRDKLGMPDKAALASFSVGLVAVIGVSGWLMAPAIVGQFDVLSEELPRAVEELRESVGRYEWGQQILEFVDEDGQEVVPTEPADLAQHARGVFSTLSGLLLALLVILFVGIFLASSPQSYRRGIIRMVPVERRPRAQQVLDELIFIMKRWLLGRIIVMVIIGVITWAGLAALGVPLALVLGVLAGLLEFIPNFGPWIAAVPAILIAWTQDTTLALYVAILYFVIQQVESFVLTPLVLKETVKLPPVLTITAIVAMGVLFGPVGVLLASPVLAAGLVLVRMLYVEDALGDRAEDLFGEDAIGGIDEEDGRRRS
jgi:predicted PurR-regulated permease PerM